MEDSLEWLLQTTNYVPINVDMISKFESELNKTSLKNHH